jgi:[ribosomal protein S18]-alanine N-acetyltransferase
VLILSLQVLFVLNMAVLERIRSIFRPLPEPEIIIPAPLMNYGIRPLTTKHLDDVVKLNHRCFLKGESYSRNTFNYLLKNPQTLAYQVVTPTELIIGFIVITVGEDRVGHITTIGVAPEHRKRGIAKKLLIFAETSLTKRGVGTVHLEVRVSNTGAQKLYQSLDYFITQRFENYYNNSEDGFVMVKSLY